MNATLDFVFLGLSLTSSWGNGHATTYRALLRELARRGHRVTFLERDVPWYAENRDLPQPPFGRAELYTSLQDLDQRFGTLVRDADVVVVGSYVPEGIAVGEWVMETARGLRAFYDIDTPVTLASLAALPPPTLASGALPMAYGPTGGGAPEYISRELIRKYDLYLSFTGGPTLRRLEQQLGASMARPLYCSVDPELYYPEARRPIWDLGYLGTYSPDRQPALDRLLLETARRLPRLRFVVAGPLYPESLEWPPNVQRLAHVPPPLHRGFYTGQRATLNVTRADMVRAGYSPSVRLFEAAACGTPIISDPWDGLESLFVPGAEILVARTTEDAMAVLERDAEELRGIGRRARERVLAAHTAAHRAQELETYVRELWGRLAPTRGIRRGKAIAG